MPVITQGKFRILKFTDPFEWEPGKFRQTVRYWTDDIFNAFDTANKDTNGMPYHGKLLYIPGSLTTTGIDWIKIPGAFCQKIRIFPKWHGPGKREATGRIQKQLGAILEAEYGTPEAGRWPSGGTDGDMKDIYQESYTFSTESVILNGDQMTWSDGSKVAAASVPKVMHVCEYKVRVVNDLFDEVTMLSLAGKLNQNTWRNHQPGFWLYEGADVELSWSLLGKRIAVQNHKFKYRSKHWNYFWDPTRAVWDIVSPSVYESGDFSALPLYVGIS